MSKTVNIIKLCVGLDSVEALEAWHKANRSRYPAGRTLHMTRMFPKRVDEVIGGSIYWVFKGQVLARQKIHDLEEIVDGQGIKRCVFVLDAEVIRTEPAPRRPFQGWRYLAPEDSPPDRAKPRPKDDVLPPALAAALSEIGLR